MTTRISRAAAACALLATTCLVSPALAQSGSPPSAYKNIDDNGVDLTDGSFNFSLVEGSIGAGAGTLALIRYGAGGSSLDNRASTYLYQEQIGSTAVMTVALANRSEAFVADGAGGFTPRQGNGATLSGSGNQYTYRDADGSEIAFGPSIAEDYAGQFAFCDGTPNASCRLPALRIVEPGGKTETLTWDVLTKCDQVIDPSGEPAPCRYFWRLAGVANNLGYAMAIAYQPGGIVNGQASPAWYKRASVTFRNTVAGGQTPTVSYAFPAAYVTEVTDTGGRTWRITTDSSGRITGIRRPGVASDSTSVVYGANGVTQVTRDGVTTSYSRTVSGTSATTVVTDALQHSRTVVSNLSTGRPTQVTDEVSQTSLFAYDGNGRLTEATAPEGNKVLAAYDARGNVTATTLRAKPGSGAADIVTNAGYESGCGNPATCNQPLWTRDAAGAQTDFAYDGAGNVLSVTAPAPTPGAVRPQTRYGYTPVAAPGGGSVSMPTGTSACRTTASCIGTADETRTTVTYATPNLLPSQVSSGAGDGSLTATGTMTYDTIGNLVTVDGPLPGAADTARTLYNASREVVGAIGPDPDPGSSPGQASGPLRHRAVRTTINAQGQATAQESGTVTDQSDAGWAAFAPLERVDASFDANGRVVRQTLSAGGTVHAAVEYSYDGEGRPDCTARRMNPASFGSLTDACSLTAAGTFGPDRITRTVYDAADQVTQKRVAAGTADEAAAASATYTPNGQLATLTDGENNKTSYSFDGHDRLSRIYYPVATKGTGASSATDYEELSYDIRSNVTSRRLRDGLTIGYGYDALGRLTSKDVPNINVDDEDVSFGYDLSGRMVLAYKNPTNQARFSWDALGRKTGDSNYYYALSMRYDLAGRRTRLTHGDGPSTGSGEPFYVGYDYLVTGEMTAIRENGATSGVGVLATFGYDDLGRRTRLTRGNGTVTSYAYDTVSRLSRLTQDLGGASGDLDLTFAYNPAGQITTNGRSNDAYGYTPQARGSPRPTRTTA